MNITFVGAGYVGLVTGTAFAEMGNRVTFVEIDENKLTTMRSGKLPIFEPGLDHLFVRNLREERLEFTSSLQSGVTSADVVFLTLPTPPSEDGSADLSHVMNVVFNMAQHLTSYTVIVTKSTVPVGTADRIRRTLEASGLTAGKDFDVVSNPEFLREGVAVQDFMKPERVVVGTSSLKAADIMRSLYEPFVRNGNPIYVMDERSAELVKYAANAFLATKISFMNEIATICERVGANVDNVRTGIGKDSRIGSQFLYAGIGYGGSCFPKDVQAMAYTARENDYDFSILQAVMDVNKAQGQRFIRRMFDYYDNDVTGRTFAIWGLAFKANTDDIREAPALRLIDELLEAGAQVIVYDPEAMANVKRIFGDRIRYAQDIYAALPHTDALIIATEWNEFRNPNLDRVGSLLHEKVIFDGRNLFDPDKMAEAGFEYYSVGRQSQAPRARFREPVDVRSTYYPTAI